MAIRARIDSGTVFSCVGKRRAAAGDRPFGPDVLDEAAPAGDPEERQPPQIPRTGRSVSSRTRRASSRSKRSRRGATSSSTGWGCPP